MSKSKSGCCRSGTNQILKTEDVAIVSSLVKPIAFFVFTHPVLMTGLTFRDASNFLV